MDLRNCATRARPFRYFGYAGLLALSILFIVERPLLPYWTLAGFAVGWPALLEAARRTVVDSSWVALTTHAVECSVLGFLLAWCELPLWPMASIVLLLLVGAAVQGGLGFLLPGMGSLAVGILLAGGLDPLRLPVASPAVTTLSVLLLYVFMLGIAMVSFQQAQRLHASRLRAVGQSASLELLNARLSRYLPQPLCRLLAQAPVTRQAPQHRWVCVAFIDVVGFSQFVQTRPAAEITDILDDYLEAIADLIELHHGVLSKMLGDGVLVYFPETDDRRVDALACGKMCLVLEPLLESLREKWRDRGQLVNLRTRVGVASGYCAIGDWGGTRRLDYTLIGAAANLASRLQQEARIGGTLICASTAALLESNRVTGEVELESQQMFIIKGFGEIQAFPLVTAVASAKVRA